MKFNVNNNSDIKQVGDIKRNNVSIDIENLDFIVTILSSNLYSNPIQSFIRETVSNAWDSHVEAGVTDPVILELGKDTEGNNFCRIQDFGVGLSPERFNKIYRNIGSSTKRDTNDLIGGFGIGRFSALAYSDMVYITSNYDGIKYQYVMYKDNNRISIDLLHESSTNERNGLEVKVYIKEGDIHKFSKAIKNQLVYFENLFIVDNISLDYLEERFNNFAIKEYKNFKVNTLDSRWMKLNLVLGKVRYPLRFENLTKPYSDYVGEYPISLKFNIGDLEVTPNREEILYSTKNIKTIEKRLDAALKEIEALSKKELNKDYSDIIKYEIALTTTPYLTLLEKDNRRVSIKIPFKGLNITYQGKKYNKQDFLGMYNKMLTIRGIEEVATKIQKTMSYTTSYENIEFFLRFPRETYVTQTRKFNRYEKIYIKEEMPDTSYFIRLEDWKYYYRLYSKELRNYAANIPTYSKHQWKYDSKIFKVIFKAFAKYFNALKRFDISSIPEEWIKKKKEEEKLKRKNATVKRKSIDWKEQIHLYQLRPALRGYGLVYDGRDVKFKELNKTFKELVVYGEKEDTRLEVLYSVLGNLITIVGVPPTKINVLKNVKNFVKIDNFIGMKYRVIRNFGTAEYIRRKLPFLDELYKIENLSSISTKLQKVVHELYFFKENNNISMRGYGKEQKELVEDIYQFCVEKNYFNYKMKELVDENITMLQNARYLLHFAKLTTYYRGYKIPEDKVNIAVDYALARKLFRPDLAAVQKLRKETIFNIKPEENENN